MAWVTKYLLKSKDSWGTEIEVKNSDGVIFITVTDTFLNKTRTLSLREFLDDGVKNE
jgi:hypothetical protein